MAKKILVVDDDAMNLRMAEFILGKASYEVIQAKSGKEALEILGTSSVDLILLDIAMPEMNGFETLEEIRKEDSLARIPVIFLTASTDEETIQVAEERNVNGIVNKPFLPPKLQGAVKEILGE